MSILYLFSANEYLQNEGSEKHSFIVFLQGVDFLLVLFSNISLQFKIEDFLMERWTKASLVL
jgi:hypothetical protein